VGRRFNPDSWLHFKPEKSRINKGQNPLNSVYAQSALILANGVQYGSFWQPLATAIAAEISKSHLVKE
jgi:hypothetical protein